MNELERARAAARAWKRAAKEAVRVRDLWLHHCSRCGAKTGGVLEDAKSVIAMYRNSHSADCACDVCWLADKTMNRLP